MHLQVERLSLPAVSYRTTSGLYSRLGELAPIAGGHHARREWEEPQHSQAIHADFPSSSASRTRRTSSVTFDLSAGSAQVPVYCRSHSGIARNARAHLALATAFAREGALPRQRRLQRYVGHAGIRFLYHHGGHSYGAGFNPDPLEEMEESSIRYEGTAEAENWTPFGPSL